jgi:argininosuccinate lyase
MPQKRNPVALEHARALASKALGQAVAIMLAVHNTPFGDVVDTEDDLQPLVFSMFRDAMRATGLVAAAMKGAEFDVARLEARAAEGGITLTELADTLVREHGLAFRVAHAIAARVATVMRQQPEAGPSKVLADASQELLGTPLDYSEEQLRNILSPRHFVEVRRTHGGPALEETSAALARSSSQLEADEAWLRRTRDALAAAETRLRERSARL